MLGRADLQTAPTPLPHAGPDAENLAGCPTCHQRLMSSAGLLPDEPMPISWFFFSDREPRFGALITVVVAFPTTRIQPLTGHYPTDTFPSEPQ
jgi:hypothetical protein